MKMFVSRINYPAYLRAGDRLGGAREIKIYNVPHSKRI